MLRQQNKDFPFAPGLFVQPWRRHRVYLASCGETVATFRQDSTQQTPVVNTQGKMIYFFQSFRLQSPIHTV